jgi:pyrroloquinoline quinone biosynthesis protein D
MIDGSARPRLAPHARLRRRGDETLLLAPERGFVLDGTAAEVLARCDGATAVDALVQTLAAEHQAPPEVVRRDVERLLAQLVARGAVIL